MKTLILTILFLSLWAHVRCQDYQTDPVQTNSGTVVGLHLETVQNHYPYSSFKGIPYATAQRFKPAQETQWNGTLYAFNDKDMCLQKKKNKIMGSEDCLYLNVYSPDTNYFGSNNKNGLKPVIVWIHGGAFKTGSGRSDQYGPDFLLEAEIVVVSIQYRLGPLGFLNIHNTMNLGLKDQVIALRWIKDNIAAFGGDPDRITLLGHSAGGVSVDLHTLSQKSRGLFNQTISMSGSPLCNYWPFQSNVEAKTQAFLLGLKLGFNTQNEAELVNFLSNKVKAIDIINKSNELPGILPFRPTLEKGPDAFMSECAPKLYHEGNFQTGAHLMGYTSDEILFMAFTPDALIKWDLDLVKLIRRTNLVRAMPELSKFFIRKFEAMANLKTKVFSFFIKIISDLYFTTGIDMKQRLLAKHNQAPVYYFRYDFKAPTHESIHKSEGVEILDGAAHEDQLPYIFYMHEPFVHITLDNPEIALTRNRLIRMWSNFARFGNPTPFGAKDRLLQGITWPDSGKDGILLEITDNLTIKSRPTNEMATFYEDLGFSKSKIYNSCNPYKEMNVFFDSVGNSIMRAIGTAHHIVKEIIEMIFDK